MNMKVVLFCNMVMISVLLLHRLFASMLNGLKNTELFKFLCLHLILSYFSLVGLAASFSFLFAVACCLSLGAAFPLSSNF